MANFALYEYRGEIGSGESKGGSGGSSPPRY